MKRKITLEMNLVETVTLRRVLQENIVACEEEAQEAEKKGKGEWAECMREESEALSNILVQLRKVDK